VRGCRMTAPSPWLTREELAERLRLKPQTLAVWAVHKEGPPYSTFGGRVRYHLAQVEAWEATQAVDWSETA